MRPICSLSASISALARSRTLKSPPLLSDVMRFLGAHYAIDSGRRNQRSAAETVRLPFPLGTSARHRLSDAPPVLLVAPRSSGSPRRLSPPRDDDLGCHCELPEGAKRSSRLGIVG